MQLFVVVVVVVVVVVAAAAAAFGSLVLFFVPEVLITCVIIPNCKTLKKLPLITTLSSTAELLSACSCTALVAAL